MTRRWVVLLALVTVLALFSIGAFAASFPEKLPTHALYRPTSYTLQAGEWQIGLPTVLAPLAVSVEYGLTDGFQIGTMPLMLAFGQVYVGAKLGLPLGETFDIGLPFGFGFYPAPIGFVWNAGATLSLRAGEGFTLHGGASVSGMQQILVSPFVVADLDVSPNFKAVGEVGLLPLMGGGGVLVRLLDFLEIRVGIMFPYWFHGGIAARF